MSIARAGTSTAERAAQQELAQAQGALRQAATLEAVGQLTGGIAHDFNNLLTGIIGSLDLIRRAHGRALLDKAAVAVRRPATEPQPKQLDDDCWSVASP